MKSLCGHRVEKSLGKTKLLKKEQPGIEGTALKHTWKLLCVSKHGHVYIAGTVCVSSVGSCGPAALYFTYIFCFRIGVCTATLGTHPKGGVFVLFCASLCIQMYLQRRLSDVYLVVCNVLQLGSASQECTV